MAKNVTQNIKNTVGQHKKHPVINNQTTSRHMSSVSFGNTLQDRFSTKPRSKNPEKDAKFIKTDAKKTISTDSIFNYNASNYNSSNIIKMLRVKQEVTNDPRLGLSKDQLLTRLITMEQEYKNLKKTYEKRRSKQNLSNRQVKDYKELIDLSCENMVEYSNKVEELNTAIQKLCRINYWAVDLYKEIMDVAKMQDDMKSVNGTQNIIYMIIEKIEHFLSNSNFDITQYEHIMQENAQFLNQWKINQESLWEIKENLFSYDPRAEEKLSCSPSGLSLTNSQSHSKIMNSFIDDSKFSNNDLSMWKERFLTKNPSMSNCSEMNSIKSRNLNQNTLSSKTLIETDRYNSSRHVKDQSSINQFERKIFMTAENNKRKFDSFEDRDYEKLIKTELENGKLVILNFLKDYDLVWNEILHIKEQNANIHIHNKVFEICAQTSHRLLFEETLGQIDQLLVSNHEEFQKIEKLLEDLSIMILSNQKNKTIDQEAWDLIQRLFGDKVLVKILKHIDSCTKTTKGAHSGTTRKQMNNHKTSLLKLRKFMMQLEMNVTSRDQFMVDENEQEVTQNLFVQALAMVDKLLISIKSTNFNKSNSRSKINENSTNKSNSEWDTKSISCEKTTFDVESRCGIQPNYACVRRQETVKVEDKTALHAFSNKRSISVDERANNCSPSFVIKCEKQPDTKDIIQCSPLQIDSNEKSKDIDTKGCVESEDFFNMIYLQASHIENLTLYIEDINTEMDKN